MSLAGTGAPGVPNDSRSGFEQEAVSCQPALTSYANQLTGCNAAADDLVQETLLRAIRAWRSFVPGTQMGAWLRTILYHQFVNWYRSRRRMQDWALLAEVAGPDDAPAWGVVHPEWALSRSLLGDRLEGAIRRLSPKQREAVRLAEVEGYAGNEVAALLGVTPGTVKSRLYRARRTLQEALRATAAELGYGRCR